MEVELAAKQLAELGHVTRLQIFRYLVKKGRKGVSVGEIKDALNVPGSTFTHHISRLVSVGLLEQKRDGRVLYCVPHFHELQKLIGFLQDECCVWEDEEGC